MMVLIAGIVFGVMPSAVTYCYGLGANSSTMVASRYLVLSLVLLPIVLRQKNTFKIYRQNFFRVLILSVAGVGTPLLLYTAYNYLSTGMTTTLHFLYPTMVAVILVVFFRERLSGRTALCLALCVAGILLMLDTSGQWSVTGFVIALASGLAWAWYIVLLDKFCIEGVSSEQMIFYVGINGFVIMLLYSLLTRTLVLDIAPVGWLCIFGANFVIAVFGSIFFAMGVRHTDAQVSAIAGTLEPITSVIVGVLFLHEKISIRTGIGAVLVLAAVVLMALAEKDKTSA